MQCIQTAQELSKAFLKDQATVIVQDENIFNVSGDERADTNSA